MTRQKQLRRNTQTASDNAAESRPPLFVQGLISPVFHAFENGMLSFPSALSLSLYTSPEAQREIVGLKLVDESPEIVLRNITDPFYAGDILNRLAREPGRLKILGYDNLRAFLKAAFAFLVWPKPLSHAPGRGHPRSKARRAHERSRRAALEYWPEEEGKHSFAASGFLSTENNSTSNNLSP